MLTDLKKMLHRAGSNFRRQLLWLSIAVVEPGFRTKSLSGETHLPLIIIQALGWRTGDYLGVIVGASGSLRRAAASPPPLPHSARNGFHHRPDKSKGAGEILRNTRPFVSIHQMEKCGCKLKWSHFLHMWASLCDDLLFRGRNLLSCRELTSYPFLAPAHSQAGNSSNANLAAEEKFPLSRIDFQSPQSDLWILDEPRGLKYLPKAA